MISADRLEEMFMETWLQARMFSGIATTFRDFDNAAQDIANASFECKVIVDNGRPTKGERQAFFEQMRQRRSSKKFPPSEEV